MDLWIGTIVLRPYVFGFIAVFLLGAGRDLGWRRALGFAAWVAPLAWACEFTSTRIGIPFGLYHYTETTREQEWFVGNVPMMDSLSFTFLTYAAFCLARGALAGRQTPPAVIALASGVLMMLLDVVIDPVAVRGDQWFLGHIFAYAEPGAYFGVPLSNFAGWIVLGTVSVGGYLSWSRWREERSRRAVAGLSSPGSDAPPGHGHTGWGSPGVDRYGRRYWPGIALYYAVLAFNLVVTGWIGEWLLLLIGAGVHVMTAAVLWNVGLRPATRLGLEKQRA
jgi:putative membrane protein